VSDWEPLGRPRPEHAQEFATLLARLQATGDESVLDRMNAIAIPPWETIGAPRIGIDDAADDWLRARVSEDDLYETSMKMYGYCVLDLLPPCDGFTTNEPTWPKLDRYVFRGAQLRQVRRELGALYEEGQHYKSAGELEDFGERLTTHARRFARTHRVMEVELVRSVPSDATGAHAYVLFAAARWCLYWARRGHGLAP
jgi:hypothetical protein